MDLNRAIEAIQAVLNLIKDVYGIETAYLIPRFSWGDGKALATVALVIRDLGAMEPGDMIDLMRTLSDIKSGPGCTVCLLPRLYEDARHIEPEVLREAVAILLKPCFIF